MRSCVTLGRKECDFSVSLFAVHFGALWCSCIGPVPHDGFGRFWFGSGHVTQMTGSRHVSEDADVPLDVRRRLGCNGVPESAGGTDD